MKKIIVFILISFINITYSDTINARYFPLKIGNIYVYNYLYVPISGQSSEDITYSYFSKDTVANGHKYFYWSDSPLLHAYYNTSKWFRLDSNSLNIFSLDVNGICSYYPKEVLLDSLNAKINDISLLCKYSSYDYDRCIDTGYINLFGINHKFKNFMVGTGFSKKFVQDIGLQFCHVSMWGTEYYTLKGCVLNGVVYGDTNRFVNVTQISYNIPKEFKLEQNYPNPFNPYTKIKFNVKYYSEVKIIISDILGNEINNIVNGKYNSGTYESEFDGEDLSSGIYFYRLIVNGILIETKKMLLVK